MQQKISTISPLPHCHYLKYKLGSDKKVQIFICASLDFPEQYGNY